MWPWMLLPLQIWTRLCQKSGITTKALSARTAGSSSRGTRTRWEVTSVWNAAASARFIRQDSWTVFFVNCKEINPVFFSGLLRLQQWSRMWLHQQRLWWQAAQKLRTWRAPSRGYRSNCSPIWAWYNQKASCIFSSPSSSNDRRIGHPRVPKLTPYLSSDIPEF